MKQHLMALWMGMSLWGAAVAAQDESFEGILTTQLMAIGGETTGTGLHTVVGFFELVLTKEQLAKIDPMNGRAVLVTGKRISLSGIERGQRPAIEVRTLRLPPKLDALTGTLLVTGPRGGTPARMTLHLANGKKRELIVGPELRGTLGKLNKKTVRVSGISATRRGAQAAGHPRFVVEKIEPHSE